MRQPSLENELDDPELEAALLQVPITAGERESAMRALQFGRMVASCVAALVMKTLLRR